jgi:hypothetical protein
MATWTVSTAEKKLVEEHELWQKDDMVIRVINGYRWGTWLVTTDDDDPPELDQTEGSSANAVNMYDCGYDTELVSLDDGCYGDIIWPDDMPDDERERLQEIWDEDWALEGWEEQGWTQYDTECWAAGKLEITKEED